MARGKHGISAAARQAVDERDREIAAYQHNIRKLTAENAELKKKLDDLQASHSKTVRVLKTERDEGLSPQLAVLQQENERLKVAADAGDRWMKQFRDWHNKIFNRIADHVQTVERLTKLEAIHLTHQLMGEFQEDEWTPPEYKHASKIGADAVVKIQQARGVRR